MIKRLHLLKYNALYLFSLKKQESNIKVFLELANVKMEEKNIIIEKEVKNETLGHVAPS